MTPQEWIVGGINAGLTYRGRPVEELSKDELIEAVYDATRTRDDVLRLHEDYVRFTARVREVR